MRFRSTRRPWGPLLLVATFVAGFGGAPEAARPAEDQPSGRGHLAEATVRPRLPDHELAQIRARESERAAAARARRLADPALALPDGGDLLIGGSETDVGGITHTRLHPTVDGVLLYRVLLMVHTGPRGEGLHSPAAEAWSFPPLARSTARIDKEEAVRRAHGTLREGRILDGSKASLYYFPFQSGEPWRLVYLVSTRVAHGDGSADIWRHAIGAESGEVLDTTHAVVDQRTLDDASGAPGDPQSETCFCVGSQVFQLGCERCPSGFKYECHSCFSNGGGLDQTICALNDQTAGELCRQLCDARARRGNCPFPL